MKLALAFLISVFSISAFACNREAQFIGTVTKLKVADNAFSFQLKLGRWFVPSMVCPLFEDEFEAAVINLPGSPRIADGDEISGVLVYDVATDSYIID